jgi:hypothetical protein
MKEKTKKFKQIRTLHNKFYDYKTKKYYLPHIFKVDDKRPDYIIAIP